MGSLLQALVFSIVFSVLQFLGFEASFVRLGAFLFLCVLTGCFHEDGLADSFDSLGVSIFDNDEESRKRALAAMKDPRLGSFGVSSLIVLWILRVAASYFLVQLSVIVSIILVTRASSLYFGKLIMDGHGDAAAVKSSHLLKAVSSRYSAAAFALMLLLSGFGFILSLSAVGGALLLGLGVAVPFLFLFSFSKRHGGVNGDVMGGAACFTELVLFFVFLGMGHHFS